MSNTDDVPAALDQLLKEVQDQRVPAALEVAIRRAYAKASLEASLERLEKEVLEKRKATNKAKAR